MKLNYMHAGSIAIYCYLLAVSQSDLSHKNIISLYEIFYWFALRCVLPLSKADLSSLARLVVFFPARSASPKLTEAKPRKTADTQILRYTEKYPVEMR